MDSKMQFRRRFNNIDINTEEAQRRFVNRMLYVLFPKYPIPYGDELQVVSRAIGETITSITDLETLVHSDFCRMLDMLERLTRHLPHRTPKNSHQMTSEKLIDEIRKELDCADIDLEVDWKDGAFFPRSAALLDRVLVDEPLDWLTNLGLSSAATPFRKSLDHLLHARNDPKLLSDAITDAFDALESMAKETCKNNNTFDANRETFIKKANVSDSFKRITKELAQYAHSFRHGSSETRPKPQPSFLETELFIYTVGILLRSASQSIGGTA
jgi:hypothetical protein